MTESSQKQGIGHFPPGRFVIKHMTHFRENVIDQGLNAIRIKMGLRIVCKVFVELIDNQACHIRDPVIGPLGANGGGQQGNEIDKKPSLLGRWITAAQLGIEGIDGIIWRHTQTMISCEVTALLGWGQQYDDAVVAAYADAGVDRLVATPRSSSRDALAGIDAFASAALGSGA